MKNDVWQLSGLVCFSAFDSQRSIDLFSVVPVSVCRAISQSVCLSQQMCGETAVKATRPAQWFIISLAFLMIYTKAVEESGSCHMLSTCHMVYLRDFDWLCYGFDWAKWGSVAESVWGSYTKMWNSCNHLPKAIYNNLPPTCLVLLHNETI